jgi:hypothetical protein
MHTDPINPVQDFASMLNGLPSDSLPITTGWASSSLPDSLKMSTSVGLAATFAGLQ